MVGKNREPTIANGAATKLRSAPIFVCVSAAPLENAAVAKKSDTVKPIDATQPTRIRCRIVKPDGSRAPRERAAVENRTIPTGFPIRRAAST